MKSATTLLFTALLIGATSPALAQTDPADSFPNRPIRVISPYAAGGADAYIRPLTQALETRHKMNFVIETVTGAGGAIGATAVKRSAPDGYTLLFCGTGAMTVVPKMNKVEYTLDDFDPVLNLVNIPFVLAVRKELPYKTFRELVAHHKAAGTSLTYGSPGFNSAPSLAMEAVGEQVGLKLNHVPYAGVVPAVTAIIGGHIDAVIGVPNIVLPHVRNGTLVAIGMTTRERFKLAPEVPSFAEQGADVDVATNFGFLAPKGTPPKVIEKLGAAIRDAAGDQAFIDLMGTMQNGMNILSAAEFGKALRAEAAYFAPVIEKLKAKAEGGK